MSINVDIKYGESIPLLYISKKVLFKPGYLLRPVWRRTLQYKNTHYYLMMPVFTQIFFFNLDTVSYSFYAKL